MIDNTCEILAMKIERKSRIRPGWYTHQTPHSQSRLYAHTLYTQRRSYVPIASIYPLYATYACVYARAQVQKMALWSLFRERECLKFTGQPAGAPAFFLFSFFFHACLRSRVPGFIVHRSGVIISRAYIRGVRDFASFLFFFGVSCVHGVCKKGRQKSARECARVIFCT